MVTARGLFILEDKNPGSREILSDDASSYLVSKSGTYMCLWCGMLYVVIEGWEELGLSWL
jgi:hypothetical protein